MTCDEHFNGIWYEDWEEEGYFLGDRVPSRPMPDGRALIKHRRPFFGLPQGDMDVTFRDVAATLVHGCEGDCSADMVEAIRESLVDVLRSISRHRQRGADLVYEAYHVDIGGG